MMPARRSLDHLPLVSLIVPALNEATRLALLHRRIVATMQGVAVRWELLLVDDGSRDGTGAVWGRLMVQDPRLGLVVLTRTFGKESALLAGLRRCRGDAAVFLDADLQDPPEVIARFVARWRAGYDMVYGVRRRRVDAWWKRLTAAGYYRLLRAVCHLEIPAAAGDFRLLDRTLVDHLLALPECDRFTRGLYQWIGGSSCAVAYDRPARQGPARYSLTASCDQALAGLAFTDAPLRGVIAVGVGVSILSLVVLVVVVVRHLAGVDMAWGWASLVSLIAVLGGMQLTATGVIGLYIGRIYRESKRRPPYLVARAIDAREPSSCPSAHPHPAADLVRPGDQMPSRPSPRPSRVSSAGADASIPSGGAMPTAASRLAALPPRRLPASQLLPLV